MTQIFSLLPVPYLSITVLMFLFPLTLPPFLKDALKVPIYPSQQIQSPFLRSYSGTTSFAINTELLLDGNYLHLFFVHHNVKLLCL